MKQITITTNKQADKLKTLPFNRAFKVRDDLVEKMNKYGFIVPILVISTDLITGKLEQYIVDGQHRFITARFLGIPVKAEILDYKAKTVTELVNLVASLNVTHKS